MAHSRARLRRAVRVATVGPGPLKRRLDRVEFMLRVALAGLLLAAVPLGLVAGGAAAARGRAIAAEQLAVRHQVTAHLVMDADSPRQAPAGPDGSLQLQQSLAVWTDPDGTLRQAVVPAPAGSHAGSSIRLWTDSAGRPVAAPLSTTDIRTRTVAVGVTTALGIGLVGYVGYLLLVRCALNSRRMRRWERDWAIIEPRWTRRVP